MSVFEENVSNIRFIAWDTETTGLSPRIDEIVEIGAVAFDEDFEHRVFESLIRPRMAIPTLVSSIHGITDSMVQDSPTPDVVLPQFVDFLTWSGQPRVLVAHNASFDVGMVHGEWIRQKTSSGRRGASDLLPSPEICIDSCQLARSLIDDAPRHSLEALAEYFGISHASKHRAMGDVKVLKEVFLRLLGLASDRYADANGLRLERLIMLCGGYYELHTNPASVSIELIKGAFKFSPALERISILCGGSSSIAICYDRDEEWRYVTPIGMKTKNSRVYVEAFCHRDQMKKTFRGDRIRSVGKVLET
ncbi:MAG TPA: exonuclease domain-containing protein [Oligoflexia bacterium]|nr:exonuclease domain-containing protein [Oligoflexia bacterium]